MTMIKIFESDSLIGLDRSNPEFRRTQIAKGKSVYCISTTKPSITKHKTRDGVHTNKSVNLIGVSFRRFNREGNYFHDGTWHVDIDTALTLSVENDEIYSIKILDRLMKNPQYTIEAYEYGLYNKEICNQKEDTIFNWYNRHLGEIWIEEEDLNSDEYLKLLFEQHSNSDKESNIE